MDKSERWAWAASQATAEFLKDLGERYRPDDHWTAASGWDQVNRLKGQREVLAWVKQWIDGDGL